MSRDLVIEYDRDEHWLLVTEHLPNGESGVSEIIAKNVADDWAIRIAYALAKDPASGIYDVKIGPFVVQPR